MACLLLPLDEVVGDGVLHRLHVDPVPADGHRWEGDLGGGQVAACHGGDGGLVLPIQLSVHRHEDRKGKTGNRDDRPKAGVH